VRFRNLAPGAAIAAGLAAALAIGVFGIAPAMRRGHPTGPPGVSFRPGARQAYRLGVESSLRFVGMGTDGRRTIQQRLGGTLHLRVLDPGPDGARVALQLAGASLTLGGGASEELDRQLGRLFLVGFAPDGAPTRFEFPPAIGEEARTVLREAVLTFQAIVPPGAGAAWTTEEVHASGRYRAAYRYTTDGRILKTKVAYLHDAGGGAEAATVMRLGIRRAEATIRIDPTATWLERMVVEEEVGASLMQGLYSPSSLLARLDRVPVEAGAPRLEIDEAPGSYRELSAALAMAGPAAAPSGVRAPAPSPRSLAALVRALDAKSAISVALLYELRDLLDRDPATAAEIVALLAAGVPDRTAAALLNALGMSATEEAQAALRAVIEEPAFGRMNRTRAALALGGAPQIGEESLAALRALAGGSRSDGPADTAVLALGLAGDTLRRSGAPGYAELREDLMRRARDARDGRDAATALLALGNTHDPAVAEAVAARLDDASSAARSAAAHALGKLGDSADPDVLARRLAIEEDGTVRSTIASSLNALPPPSAAALALVAETIARERESQARYELVRLLGENLATYPAGRETLTTLAKEDPSRRIREYATHVVWRRTP